MAFFEWCYCRRQLLRQGLMLTGLGALAGCDGGDSPNPPAESSGSTGSASKPKRFKIAGVGFQDDQFFKLCEMGVRDAAAKANVDLVQGNSAGSTDKEASLIETYVTQKIDAIVIAVVNKTASIPALQRAHEAGVKIVTYDASVDADFPAANIRSDQISLGKLTGQVAHKYVSEKLGGKAKIAVITYLALIPEMATQRNKGFLDEVKKLPGVEIVTTNDAWMADKAVTVVDDVLTRHPDLNLIWGANEGGTVGAVTAVRNAGKAGKVAVFGTDVSEQMCGFLLDKDNVLQAVTGQKPFEIGQLAVETAVKALKGEKVEKQTLLPGQLFDRSDPEAVKKYKDYLAGLSKA
jgi:ABC-type sugar transport system substrate-binding protein